MTRFLLALALCAGTALPAVAQTAEAMSCADFAALDAAGQEAAMAPAEGGMMAGATMAADDGARAAAACAAHPEMTVGEALAATE